MLATPAATIQQPRDFGQAIAAEYWRKTPHIWSSQGNGKPCGLCLLPGTVNRPVHVEGVPYPPAPTISSVVSDGITGYHFTATLSCGHGPVGFATTPERAPKVGDSYDCWDCRRPVDDLNYPPLPDEIRQRIEALLPRCPMCSGPITKIPFIKRTVHAFSADLDARTGEIMAGSEHEDTLEEVPDYHVTYRQGEPVRELEVECANGHSWLERRLAYEYDYRAGEHVWRVSPPLEPVS